MHSLLKITIAFIAAFLFISCGSDSVAPDPESSAIDPVDIGSEAAALQPVKAPDIQATLAQVRRTTAKYHDVEKTETDGYVHPASPPEFVPNMGYHYANFSLLDGDINPLEPEVLVYVDNPARDDARRLVAVEYVIPDPAEEMSHTDLDDKFPGVDGEKWHFDPHVGPGAWTLHAWVWYPNPEGVFHGHNPRVGDGS